MGLIIVDNLRRNTHYLKWIFIDNNSDNIRVLIIHFSLETFLFYLEVKHLNDKHISHSFRNY